MTFVQPHLFEVDMNDVKFQHDPIAVAIVRNESDNPLHMHEVDKQIHTHKYILNGDYLAQADKIRQYYRKKLFMGAMDNRFSNTSFRMNLGACLQREDIYTLKGSEIGMIAKLPEFYAEDVAREKIRQECDVSEMAPPMYVPDAKVTVRFVTKTVRRFGNKQTYTYWFKKIMDNRAFCMHIEESNPLIMLWDDYLQDKKVFELRGDWKLRRQDDFYFFQGPCRVIV